MDFIANLLNNVPNKNRILLEISDNFAGNKEYIKDFRTPIMHEMVREKYKEYQSQYSRGTISKRIVCKNIENALAKDGFYMSSEAIRKVISR